MTGVLLSCAVLLVSPLLAIPVMRLPQMAALLDGFVLVAVGGLVAFHIVPEAFAQAPFVPGVVAFVAGLLLPMLAHQRPQALRSGWLGRGVAVLVGLAVLVHAMMDGVALATAGALHSALALGVLLHRLPVGLVLWLVVKPQQGTRAAVALTVLLIAGSLIGGVFSSVVSTWSLPLLSLLQIAVAGSILHVIAEAPVVAVSDARGFRLAAAAGAIIALLSLAAMPSEGDANQRVLSAFLSYAPAYLVGVVLAGVVAALFQNPPRALGAVSHTVPGLVLTLWLSPVLFVWRLLGMLALTTLLREALGPTLPLDFDTHTHPVRRFWRGVFAAVDHTLPWVVLGTIAASALEGGITDAPTPWRWLWLVLAAVLAAPLYLCPAGVVPLGAALMPLGPGSVVALWLSGPHLGFAAWRHVLRARGKRAALLLVVVVGGTATVVGAAVELLSPGVTLMRPAVPMPVAMLAVVVVGVLALLSIYRQGPRGFVGQVLSLSHALEDDHLHGPGCAHSHGHRLPPFRMGQRPATRVALSFDPRETGERL